jgi:hypothetical protein
MIENLVKPFAFKASKHTNGPGSENQALIFADLVRNCKLLSWLAISGEQPASLCTMADKTLTQQYYENIVGPFVLTS